jgi:hypothetical protein
LPIALQLAVTAAVCLWTIDVLVNLALVESILVGKPPHSRPVDFVGLFLAGGPLSIGTALGALIAATILTALLRRDDRQRDAVALLSAALSALAVFGQLAWPPSRSAIVIALIAAGMTGLAVYFGLRAGRGSDESAEARNLSRHVLLVPLFAGFVAASGVNLPRGEYQAILLNGLQAMIVAGLFLRGAFRGRAGWSTVVGWIPPLAAVTCALLVCVSSARYGKPGTPSGHSASGERPNIVLIVLDTVRADHLKRYGYSRNTMPALERWASDSFVFRRAVSTSGWTSPAHASLFSGLTVSHHGIHYAGGTEEAAPFSTPSVEGITWLPARLSDEGYHGLAITANELAIPEGVSGFDRILAPSRAAWSRLTLGSLTDRVIPWTGRLSESLRWRMPYVDAGGMVDVAMRALPGETNPVFLFLNVLDAHSPYNPHPGALDLLDLEPGHLFSRYEQHRQLTLMWESLPPGRSEFLRDLYDGELRWIDHHLERFLDWVDERLGPNTVVVVTSDHGEELGEEGRVGHEYGLSQSLIHVPLFVKGPELPSGESDTLVSLRNVFAFMERIGAGAVPDLKILQETDEYGILSERYPSGHNLRVLGPAYARHWISLIEGGLKAVGPSSAGWDLYDISASGFDRDLPVSGAAGGEELRARIDAFWERHQDRRTRPDSDLSEEELRRLRSLGYVR